MTEPDSQARTQIPRLSLTHPRLYAFPWLFSYRFWIIMTYPGFQIFQKKVVTAQRDRRIQYITVYTVS